eukprot:NODE_818_length_3941_cov_0.458355.p2 type:complete len:211 gc:universal NODE_818_length_3941_cov_0.458355:3255-2623(-)
MPRCVFCCSNVDKLILEYSGYHVLAHCRKCDNIADPYLEYDLVLLSLDLIIQKPQAYRHVLWLNFSYSFISRFFVLIFLFEVYINLLLVEYESILIANLWIFTLFDKMFFYLLVCSWFYFRYSRIVAIPLCISSFPILFILASILWQFNIRHDYIFVYSLKMIRTLSQIQAIRLFVDTSYMSSAIVFFIVLLFKYYTCLFTFNVDTLLIL